MLQKLFGFDPNVHSVKTEILAGVTTFLTMAYILALSPNVLAAAGMDKGALFTSTVISTVLATLLMAIYAKLPFSLAPGVGLNAFFAYTVCLTMGYTWQFALTAVLLEGLIFIILTITNVREQIVNALPMSLKYAISAGIGLFIAFIGMQNSQIIVNNDATLVSLGDITQGPAMLGMIGLLVTSVLLILRVRGALLLGILITTVIGIPLGITDLNGLVGMPPSVEPILFKFEFDKIFTTEMAFVVFTFLFVDIFDTIGTLVGVSTRAGMVDKNGRIPHLKKAFLVDAVGTTAGAMVGTSTVTTFVESASGVAEGGRTGLTSFTTAICFIIALFLAPFFLSVPGAATAPVLILVGLMMMSQVQKIDFANYSESIPAFLCIVMMPLSYSISEGIALGMIAYVLLHLCAGKYKSITVASWILAAFFVLKYLI
ncbi:MAG: NCS2 family permease [Anaerobiospirillum succiniciproducens]|uniref:NCS2 family permease n=1 Tax=Anaerobiospirillum succiniciproducens TaxID=13335 RepID=UPI0026DD7992|nr:NCS2 family permease [Anaerobiospirillum succiniciproducens]MDO4676006.1 NCS2 family permease [Anaerobiospirillum succiniciproducens]